PPFPYTTLFRSIIEERLDMLRGGLRRRGLLLLALPHDLGQPPLVLLLRVLQLQVELLLRDGVTVRILLEQVETLLETRRDDHGAAVLEVGLGGDRVRDGEEPELPPRLD